MNSLPAASTAFTPGRRDFLRVGVIGGLGLTLGDDDAMWLGGYQTTAEYQSLKDAYEDFGEAALR